MNQRASMRSAVSKSTSAPFVDRGEHGLGGGEGALGLAVDHGGGADEGHEAGGVVGRAAGELVALGVPRLDDVGWGRGLHPGLGGGEEVFGRDDLVDQAGGLGGGGREHLALEEQRGGGHRAHHPDEAGGAAGAGEDADQDLGEADPGLRGVGDEAAMAGEGDLGADAGGEAGEGAGDGLAALQGLRVHAGALDLPEQPVHRHDAVEEAAGRGVAGAVLHAGEQVEVHAGGEVGLGRGDDEAGDGGVGERGVDGGVEVGDALVGEDVHRLAWQVPGDGCDAVGVNGGAEDRHGMSSGA